MWGWKSLDFCLGSRGCSQRAAQGRAWKKCWKKAKKGLPSTYFFSLLEKVPGLLLLRHRGLKSSWWRFLPLLQKGKVIYLCWHRSNQQPGESVFQDTDRTPSLLEATHSLLWCLSLYIFLQRLHIDTFEAYEEYWEYCNALKYSCGCCLLKMAILTSEFSLIREQIFGYISFSGIKSIAIVWNLPVDWAVVQRNAAAGLKSKEIPKY